MRESEAQEAMATFILNVIKYNFKLLIACI